MLVLRRKLDSFIVRANNLLSSCHGSVTPPNPKESVLTITQLMLRKRDNSQQYVKTKKNTYMHKYHIQVNIQFLYNIYINYKTQKQKNYRNTKTIEPIPDNCAILLERYSGKQQKFWKYLSGNLSCLQRLVIEFPFDKVSCM